MGACVNKEQQVPEYQQPAKPQRNTRSNKNVSIRHENISKFRLIPHPHRHQMTRSETSSDDSSDSGTRQKPTKHLIYYIGVNP